MSAAIYLWQKFIEWLRRLFLRRDMEVCMIGLGEAGKTSLVNLLATGDFKENVIPTVGFNMRKVQRGGILMKVWDLGGQRRFRGMWERYCRGVDAIVFVVDAAERSRFPEAAQQIHTLLQKPSIEKVPILVVGNKIDLREAVNSEDLFAALMPRSLGGARKVDVLMMSCKTKANFNTVVDWLVARSR